MLSTVSLVALRVGRDGEDLQKVLDQMRTCQKKEDEPKSESSDSSSSSEEEESQKPSGSELKQTTQQLKRARIADKESL